MTLTLSKTEDEVDIDETELSSSDMFQKQQKAMGKHGKSLVFLKTAAFLIVFVTIVVLYFSYDWLDGENTMAKTWIQVEMVGLAVEFPFFFCMQKVMVWRQQ